MSLRRFHIVFSALALGACQSIGNFADGVGSHLPVIGERCEHWQCFTEEGKQRSRANRTIREQETQQEEDGEERASPATQPAPSAPTPYDSYPATR